MKCKKNMESKSPNNVKNKNGKKKKCFYQNVQCVILSKLTGIKIPTLSDLPIVNILF